MFFFQGSSAPLWKSEISYLYLKICAKPTGCDVNYWKDERSRLWHYGIHYKNKKTPVVVWLSIYGLFHILPSDGL